MNKIAKLLYDERKMSKTHALEYEELASVNHFIISLVSTSIFRGETRVNPISP